MRTKYWITIYALTVIFLLISLSSTSIADGSTYSSQSILTIDGYGKSVTLPDIEGWDLVILQNAPNTIIENQVYDDGNTIFAIYSDNLVIRNNTIKNSDDYGIFVEFSENVQIYNNTIENGTDDGLISYLNDNVIISNNRISGVVKNGIFANGNNVTISNNEISDIAGTGIFVERTTDLIVKNNSINNVEWTPIAPDQTSFDSGIFVDNKYNGVILTDDEINPTKKSSKNGLFSPTITIFGSIVVFSFIRKSKK